MNLLHCRFISKNISNLICSHEKSVFPTLHVYPTFYCAKHDFSSLFQKKTSLKRDEEVDLTQKSVYKCRTLKITTNFLPNFFVKNQIVDKDTGLYLDDFRKIKGGNLTTNAFKSRGGGIHDEKPATYAV